MKMYTVGTFRGETMFTHCRVLNIAYLGSKTPYFLPN